MPLLLRVTVEADNQWRLLVGNLSERFHEARIDPDRLAAVHAALANWESLKPRIVPIQGNDRPFRQAEEELGRALIRILGSSQQLTQSFASEYGAARAQGQPLVVLVDAEDPEVRRIPWELLAGDEAGLPLEAAHAGIVARLLPGRGRPAVLPENLGVNVAVWCPTPADPVCAEVLEALDLTLARSEAGPAYRIDPHAGSTPPPEIGSTVLHIVCHGQHDAEEVRLLVGQDSAGPPVAIARLAAWVATADVVVLDVCEAGATTQSLLDALPGRFIAAGARAVIAPTRRCGGRAAEAFTAGFYSSWARGGSLAMSAAAGRNEVAAMGLGVQDSRWYNHVLYVPDADAPSRAGPPPAFWRPEGWPRPRREAEQLLGVAKELSDRDGLGFVGVEHLALALAHGEGSGVLTARIRLLLAGKVGQLEGHKKGLTAPGGRHPDSRGTPRLRAWAAQLPPNFTSDDLWTVIALDRGHLLHSIVDSPLYRLVTPAAVRREVAPEDTLPDRPRWTDTMGPGTEDATPSHEPDTPAVGLEVIAGPEDGRTLWPGPGERIGRWGAPPDVPHVLYETSLVVDRMLHRTCAVWIGPGRLQTAEPAQVNRHDIYADPERTREITLYGGDILKLSRATWLRGLRVANSGAPPKA